MLIGSEAPDFTAKACLQDNTFTEVTLSSFRGQYVVLFFYNANFDAVCATEVPGFEKLSREFAKRQCIVLGISADSESSHKVWKLMPMDMGGIGEISYPLLSDPNKEIAQSYDCVMASGECARGVFLIDDEGIVQAEHRNNLPLGRNLDEILRLLDAVQFHQESVEAGEPKVLPACWSNGCEAMAPSMEGIAKFAADGGLDRYVMAQDQSSGGYTRVMYMAPIMSSISEEKPCVPMSVKVNDIRAQIKADEMPSPRRGGMDYMSQFAAVGASPCSSMGMSPASFMGTPCGDSPRMSPSRRYRRRPSRELTKTVSQMWTC